MGQETIALGIIWYVCFLFSLTCHEAAHALVAQWGGDLTAARAGQVTLNPVPHVRREPFGTVVVPILSYALGGWMIGWASAPFDPSWQMRHPKRSAWMAAAGPAANLAIVVATGLAIRLLIVAGIFVTPEYVSFQHVVASADAGATLDPLSTALSILFSLNLLLCVFNLIPVPPLDGATVVGLFLPDEIARRFWSFMRGGPFALLGIFVAWKLLGWVFSPVFGLALSVLHPGASYR